VIRILLLLLLLLLIIIIIESRYYTVISEILVEMNKRIAAFSNMTPYNLVKRHSVLCALLRY